MISLYFSTASNPVKISRFKAEVLLDIILNNSLKEINNLANNILNINEKLPIYIKESSGNKEYSLLLNNPFETFPRIFINPTGKYPFPEYSLKVPKHSWGKFLLEISMIEEF